MSRRLAVVATGFALLFLVQSRPALALWPLPWCFTMKPFTDIFVMNVKPTGNAQRAGSGRDLVGNRAMSVTAFTSDGVLQVGFTIYPAPGFGPVVVEARLDPDTGAGPGTCFAPTAAECGAVNFERIVCPGTVDAPSAAASLRVLAPLGRAAGQLPPEG
jgi:hypothetical protein